MVAVISIFLFAVISAKSLRVSWKEAAALSAVGAVIAMHWVCFFGSIKSSNVSTALVMISTTAFFVSLLAPMLKRTRILKYEIFLGVVVVAGVAVIFHFETQFKTGILLSLTAALLGALFSIINSSLVMKTGFILALALVLAPLPPVLHAADADGKLRIVVFGGHPDDAEYKAGGTAVKWARLGHHVKIVSATNGDLSDRPGT